MAQVLLRIFSTLWYGLFFGIILPVAVMLVSVSLDQQVEAWWGIGLWQSWWLGIAGALFILAGILLIGLAIWTLYWEGKGFPLSFGSHAAFNPQRLVTSGPYSVVRHPMGTGYLMVLFGVGCLVPSLVMLVWMLPLIGGLFYEFFEFTEEIRLRQWFGEKYEAYHKTTPSLIPRLSLNWRRLSGRNRSKRRA